MPEAPQPTSNARPSSAAAGRTSSVPEPNIRCFIQTMPPSVMAHPRWAWPTTAKKQPKPEQGGFILMSDTTEEKPQSTNTTVSPITTAFKPPVNPGREPNQRPMMALGPNISSTLRQINRRHYAYMRNVMQDRTDRGDETPVPDQAAAPETADGGQTDAVPASTTATVNAERVMAAYVEGEPMPNAPDRAFSDRNGNFVSLVGEEIHDRFVVLEPLGSGSFGVVLRCYDAQRQELVAVKVLRADHRFTVQGRTEARILTDIAAAARPELFAAVTAAGQQPPSGHLKEAANDAAKRAANPDGGRVVGADHVLKLRKAFEWRGHVCIVTELLGKSLYDLLRVSHFQGVSLRLTAKFGIQLGRALLLLGSLRKPVVHVDVKPENILLVDDRRSAIKLVDFGSSCYESVPMKAQYAQSRFCRAPEVMLRLPYGCPVDTWSAATVLFEMFAGSPLFDGRSEGIQIEKFQQLLGTLPAVLIRRSRKKRLFRLVPQTNAMRPAALEPQTLEALTDADKGVDAPRSPHSQEYWFEMLSYEQVGALPSQNAEQDSEMAERWDDMHPLPIAETAARIKSDLLAKKLSNFRRAERRRTGVAGQGTPTQEPLLQVDAFCLLLARMLRFDPEDRSTVFQWIDDPALAIALEPSQTGTT